MTTTDRPDLTDAALGEMERKINAAHRMVVALCRARGTDGAREWIMSIPARPDHDPDIVISDGLMAADKMLREVRDLKSHLATARAELETEGAKLFAAVKRWLSGVGGPRFIRAEDYQALSAPTRAAIAAVCGLPTIYDVTPERAPKLERDFAAHYAEAVAREREPAIAPKRADHVLPGEHHAPLPPLLKRAS